jgi:hypothetical protein
MKYALIILEHPAQMAQRNGPEAPAYWSAWVAFGHALQAAGVAAGGAGLEPPATATTVRFAGGKHVVQDGPFADTKELLGGFFLIDVPDLDAALTWAAKAPLGPGGAVEVRPVLRMGQ